MIVLLNKQETWSVFRMKLLTCLSMQCNKYYQCHQQSQCWLRVIESVTLYVFKVMSRQVYALSDQTRIQYKQLNAFNGGKVVVRSKRSASIQISCRALFRLYACFSLQHRSNRRDMRRVVTVKYPKCNVSLVWRVLGLVFLTFVERIETCCKLFFWRDAFLMFTCLSQQAWPVQSAWNVSRMGKSVFSACVRTANATIWRVSAFSSSFKCA